MTTDTNAQTSKPVYRLGFAPYNGTDKNGQPKLDYPVEIGAVFNRKDASKGLVAKFKVTPANFEAGVLLLLPPQAPRNEELAVGDNSGAGKPAPLLFCRLLR